MSELNKIDRKGQMTEACANHHYIIQNQDGVNDRMDISSEK